MCCGGAKSAGPILFFSRSLPMNTDSHTPRDTRTRRIAMAVTLVMAIAGTTSCHHVFPVVEITPPNQPPQVKYMVGPHGFSPDFLAACAQMAWSAMCDDP